MLLQPRTRRNAHGLGSVPFDRHYSGYRLFFLFLQVLRCFSSLRSLHVAMVTGLQPAGLPHSDICGSFPVCGSPQLFAAYHVLPRLQKPRHPPFALLCFLFVNLCDFHTYSHTYASLRLNSFFCLFGKNLKLQSFFATRKNSNFDFQTDFLFFFTSLFSLSIVNDLRTPHSRVNAVVFKKTEKSTFRRSRNSCSVSNLADRELRHRTAPKRRCSSHTFRYGYLVTT